MKYCLLSCIFLTCLVIRSKVKQYLGKESTFFVFLRKNLFERDHHKIALVHKRMGNLQIGFINRQVIK